MTGAVNRIELGCAVAHGVAQESSLSSRKPRIASICYETMQHFFVAHRLGDEVRCTGAQRFDRRFKRREPGHHDERGFDPGGAAAAHQINTVAIRHLDVTQRHINVTAGELLGRFGHAGGLAHGIAAFIHRSRKNLAQGGFVVNNEYVQR